MTVLDHIHLRQKIFEEPVFISAKLEYILGLMQEYGKISASFIEDVGRNDGVLNSGVGKNLMPKLIKLNMVEKIKINRTRCLYTITKEGSDYLNLIVRMYE
jgi:hypothetical protein